MRFEKVKKTGKDYENFVRTNRDWLEDYCLYMAIKDSLGGISWIEWSKELRDREEQALKCARLELAEEIRFYRFQQYEFDKQWKKLHRYANEHGIRIIGDIPIYVAFDSADTWANPELFQFDEIICRQAWQDARRMDFPQQGSCGEIRFIVGNTIRKQDTTGG